MELNRFNDNFRKLYSQLNPEQKEAVDRLEGPVMVIAGPGTGKTHLLSMRIANLLDKTDTSPEAILALTFTESGVVSMRKKLARIIGSDAYSVSINTFHGFCNETIRENPDEFPNIIGARNITEVEQIEILEKILDNCTLKNLRPFGDNYYYIRPILHSIEELKKEGLTPKDFELIAQKNEKSFLAIEDLYYESGKYTGRMKGKYIDEQKQIEKNKDLAKIYGIYQNKLRELRFYDYSDMLMEVKLALEKNQDLLLSLQEKYLYILVDEHQDTNSAQNKILELLANYYESPNLFIVGDEKQAIYRFQGASLENFNYFKNLYKDAKLISLKSNYRSSQIILDVAGQINSAGGSLESKSQRQEIPLNLNIYQNPESEIYFIGKSILKDLTELKNPEEIAVLFRENKDALPIARIFEKLGIPFVIESDQDAMNDEDILKLRIILKAVQNYGSGEDLIQMLHLGFLQIPALDIYSIAKDPYKSNCSDRINEIKNKLFEWKKSSLNEDALKTFESIVKDSGFLNSILSKLLAIEKIRKLHALFIKLKTLVAKDKKYRLDDFFNYLNLLDEHNIFVKSEGVYAPGRVRLMTAHKSKGLEFDFVYLINLIDRQWGSRRIRELIKLPTDIYTKVDIPKGDEDERNLFYVALTRARKKLTLSYSTHNFEGKDRLGTKFLQEIDPKYIKKTEIVEEMDYSIEFAPALNISKTLEEKSLLNDLFFKHGLSATAFNNYLECPWKYFYRNLIRIPEAPNKSLLFGQAIHSALKNYFDNLIKGKEINKNNLIEYFTLSLNGFPLQKGEYEEALEKGIKALTKYYEYYSSLWRKNVLAEYSIKGIELAENIVINGKIDKIEILDTSNTVNVVDYKTGKPKTRNDLLSKTKNADGNYYRQLVFYKLLLDNYQNGRFKVATEEIDFVEPDNKGVFHREKFEIRREDSDNLKIEIVRVANEIISLDFWNKRCDDPKCEYCAMRKLRV
jgi:DNA helicase II / ATP-dependent DNA helicase PcrA